MSWLTAGGRVDIHGYIDEFKVVASLTDNTLRAYESAPWLRDAIVTADKKVSSKPRGILHLPAKFTVDIGKLRCSQLHASVAYEFGTWQQYCHISSATPSSSRARQYGADMV